MRLKSEIWVKAYVRAAAVAGAQAYVVRHGDDDAGTIYVKVSRLDGTARLFGPAPAGLEEARGDRAFVALTPVTGVPERDIDDRLAREFDFDRDIWVVEVEDREGRHFLDDWMAAEG